MQPRTLYALIGAGLLTATGAVVAEASETAPTFHLKVTPGEAWVKPGETATMSVVAEARTEQRLQLSLRTMDGVRAALSAETLDIAPGAPARAALTVAAPENATRSPLYVVVIATSADGTTRDAKAVIHFRDVAPKPVEKPYAKPAPAEKPADKPAYDVLEHRFRQIMERIEKIEKRLDALEGRLARPAPEPKPAPEPVAARMTLSPEHAVIGPEGGKVALLLASGDREGRLPLAVRYNETSGWTIKLEQDIVKLRANEREWVWIHLTPPRPCALVDAAETACSNAAAVIEYAIVQPDAPGAYVTKGTATARTA